MTKSDALEMPCVLQHCTITTQAKIKANNNNSVIAFTEGNNLW